MSEIFHSKIGIWKYTYLKEECVYMIYINAPPQVINNIEIVKLIII
jgi:hypothetical protein